MKTIVAVSLGTDPKSGEVDPTAPFMVSTTKEPSRTWFYHDEPEVIAQMMPGEREARFEAEWIEGQWKFGRRLADA